MLDLMQLQIMVLSLLCIYFAALPSGKVNMELYSQPCTLKKKNGVGLLLSYFHSEIAGKLHKQVQRNRLKSTHLVKCDILK